VPGYVFVCPFLTGDPVFAAGVEFGMLWVRMRDADIDEVLDDCFLLANQDQIKLAAARLGWRIVHMCPEDEKWFCCRMVREGWRG
jgi:hypothetical protein